jgi:hypothetical protein
VSDFVIFFFSGVSAHCWVMFRYMNAEKYGLDRIYFGGCFIRGMYALDLCLSSGKDAHLGQDMRRRSRRCHMPYDSGAKGRNVHCFCVMKGSCGFFNDFLIFFLISWLVTLGERLARG